MVVASKKTLVSSWEMVPFLRNGENVDAQLRAHPKNSQGNSHELTNSNNYPNREAILVAKFEKLYLFPLTQPSL